MVRYCGHISRSLYQGLSSTSLVKSRVQLRMRLCGFSTKALPERGSPILHTIGQVEEANTSPRVSYPAASSALLPGTSPSASGDSGIDTPAASAGPVPRPSVTRRRRRTDCPVWLPKDPAYLNRPPAAFNERSSSCAAHFAGAELATESEGSTMRETAGPAAEEAVNAGAFRQS